MNGKNGLAGRRGIRVFLAAAALFLPVVASASPSSHAQGGTAPPNIVLVLTDDLDLELGSLAYMPNLQQLLVDQGASFENYIVPLSLCCPSRSTILTGQYTHNHQVYTNSSPNGGYQKFFNLGLEATTLATALQGAGYQTVLLGKYLNGYPLQSDPLHVPVGWSEWYSPMSGNAYAGLDYTMNENGTPVYYGTLPEDYLTDVISAKADDFIVRAANAGEPFFVYLAPYNPHQPATPPVRFQNLFPGVQAPRTPSFNEADVSDKPQFIRDLPLLTDAQIADLDDLYRRRLQCMQAVDELIANLVATLDATHQLANTYIVFTSDNGYHEGQHRLKDGKYTAYEPDLRVPLIVRGPGVGGATSLAPLASEVDLAPTFAELADATLPLATDGRSLVPLFGAPPPTDWRQIHLFEEYPTGSSDDWKTDGTLEPPDGGEQPTAGLRFTGLRTTSYKYVEYDTGEREYYDLVADADELQNLYGSLDAGLREQLAQTLSGLSGCAAESCRAADSIPILAPAPAAVDAHQAGGTSSNLNRVLEPGETVLVEPSWRNTGTVAYILSGAATDYSGPVGAVYTLVDASADYGTVAPGATANCRDATGNCYEFGVSVPNVRPAAHWDATYVETLSSGATRTWALHIGNSFSDVPNTDPYYPSIETIFHNGVTAGCAEAVYCPEASVTRAEMAVFLLKSSLGAGYTPPPATGIFQDVPADDPFAPWIEDLFHRGITAGCGVDVYCPNDPVTRATMSALLLKTLLGPAYVPPPPVGIFGDVPADDPFAPWIEDLFARGITAGCQADPPLYCPDAPNTRNQMAVFLVKTFSLTTDDPVPGTNTPYFQCWTDIASTEPCAPLIDMGPSALHLGVYSGGLYPGGSNVVPAPHLTAGLAQANAVAPLDTSGAADPDGKYILVTIGFSNQTFEFCNGRMGTAETCDPWTVGGLVYGDVQAGRTDPNLVWYNGAQSGRVLSDWLDPAGSTWSAVLDDLTSRGLSQNQVQIVAIQVTFKHQIGDKSLRDTLKTCAEDASPDACQILAGYGNVIRIAREKFPNLKQVFFNGRTSGAWELPSLIDGHGNPEPFAYESGFSMKWTIEAQINQENSGTIDPVAGDMSYAPGPAAWVDWSAYNWANTPNVPPRSDGLTWAQSEFDPDDGIHETPHNASPRLCETDGSGAYVCGEAKAARPIYDFFSTNRLTQCWYLNTTTPCQ